MIGFNRGEVPVAAGSILHPPPVDLSLTKETGTRPLGGYRPGQQIVYKLTVLNAPQCKKEDGVVDECASASDITVKDVLPAGLTYVSSDPAGLYNPMTGIWMVGKLHAGNMASLQIVAKINGDAEGNITNYAQIFTASPDDFDSKPGNDSIDEDDDASITINVVTTKASLAGNVYVDENDNGARDQGEDGIGNVKILLTGKTSQGNDVSLATTTQSNGAYIFTDLQPGTYKVAEIQPDGYLDGKDAVGSAGGNLQNDQISNIQLGSGVAAVNYNFGERIPPKSSIAGNVYVDANDNGVRDQGETGIGGVKITLVGTDNQGSAVSRTTNTQSNGTYIFTNLLPGVYKVNETQPKDYLDGKDSAGSEGGSVANDMISNIHLGANTAAVNYNFGEQAGDLDLAITKSHSRNFTAGSEEEYTIKVRNVGNKPTFDSIIVTDQLPSGMAFVSGSGNGWTCGSEDDRKVVCGRRMPISPGDSTTITLKVSLAARILSQVVNVATVSTPGDNDSSNDTARDPTVITTHPVPLPDQCDSNGSSVLLFPLYSSDAANKMSENTRITLTNTNVNTTVAVHLFLVDGASCASSDAYLCLTQNQTVSFLASDLDPGTKGYIVAVAVNNQGCPISFNHLIGQADVRLASGHSGSYLAEGFRALFSGTLPGCDSNSTIAAIKLDGLVYEQPASQVAVPSLGSLEDGNNPLLVLVRTGGNLGIGGAPLGSIFGILYNDQENGFSFSFSSDACQLRQALSVDFPRTAPRMNLVIPTGRTGWMRLGPMNGNGVAGLFFNTNTKQGDIGSIFNVGVLLPKVRCGVDTYTIPVFPPNCQ